MPIQAITTFVRPRIVQSHASRRIPILLPRGHPVCRFSKPQHFSSTTKLYRPSNYKPSFGTRLRKALSETRIKWYSIPVGLGIGFIGVGQAYRVYKAKETWEDGGYVRSAGNGGGGNDGESEGRPNRRPRVTPTGPWFVLQAEVNDLH